MREKFQVFDYVFDDPELEKEFNDFFHIHDLNALFTNEDRATPIRVSYVEAKSIVNAGGANRKHFKEFQKVIKWAQDNKSYELAIFDIIYEPRSLQKLANRVKETHRFIMNEIETRHRYNTWNIVYYVEQHN